MKKLNSLDILGLPHKVIYKKDKMVEDGITCVGLHVPYPKQILLWAGLEKCEMLEILIHESLHQIDYKLKLNLGERRVQLLSFSITDLLTRNNIVKP